MDATIALPTTFNRRQLRPATVSLPRRGGGVRTRIVMTALVVAVLAGLVLGLVDGAAGRPLGDPGPATGPDAGLVGVVAISSPG